MTLSQIHTWRRKESCGRSIHSGARRGLRGLGGWGGALWQGLRDGSYLHPGGMAHGY